MLKSKAFSISSNRNFRSSELFSLRYTSVVSSIARCICSSFHFLLSGSSLLSKSTKRCKTPIGKAPEPQAGSSILASLMALIKTSVSDFENSGKSIVCENKSRSLVSKVSEASLLLFDDKHTEGNVIPDLTGLSQMYLLNAINAFSFLTI